MRAFILIVVVSFVVSVIYFFPQSDNEKVISISYAANFTNKLGRKINEVDAVISLPLYSSVKQNSNQLEFRIGNEAESFIVSHLGEIVAHETKTTNVNISLSVRKPLNIQQSLVPDYTYEGSAVNDLEVLSNSFQSSSSPLEFIQKNPSIEAITFLASVLSKNNHTVRIVSGVKLLDKIQQNPVCWLQTFENGQWNDIVIDQTERLPFKIMLPQNEITERSCQTSLVEVWGLDIADLKVTLKL